MMRLTELGPLPIALLASLGLGVVLLLIRVLVLQRIQTRRLRENRQESERLKSLVTAYRAVAGSFTPAAREHALQIEQAIADVVLFGSLRQVELAAQCAAGMKRGDAVDFQPLIEELRADLRRQLGLEPLPPELLLPASGPRRPLRLGRDAKGGEVAAASWSADGIDAN